MKKTLWKNACAHVGVALLALHLNACAAKKPPMHNESIRTVQKLHVGLLDLSLNDYREAELYKCIKDYASATVSSKGGTEKKLLEQGFLKQTLIDSLPSSTFDPYAAMQNFSLLILMFKNKENINYVRFINFLTKETRTVALPPEQFNCHTIFAMLRLISIESHPALADVYIDDRKIGEAPVWTSLKDGTYDLECKLPGSTFSKTQIQVPGEVQFMCQRENQTTSGIENEDDQSSFLEKSQNWFLYVFAGAASIGAAILPFLLLK